MRARKGHRLTPTSCHLAGCTPRLVSFVPRITAPGFYIASASPLPPKLCSPKSATLPLRTETASRISHCAGCCPPIPCGTAAKCFSGKTIRSLAQVSSMRGAGSRLFSLSLRPDELRHRPGDSHPTARRAAKARPDTKKHNFSTNNFNSISWNSKHCNTLPTSSK